MKNVIIFIQNFSRAAGSERVASLLANGLSKKGYNITVVSICGNNTCYYKLEPKVKLYTLIPEKNVDNRKSFFKVLSRLVDYYHHNKVDICIDIFASLSIYTLLLKPFTHCKNITWEHFNYKVNLGMNRLGRKLAVKFSNVIITLTYTDKKLYHKYNKHVNARIKYIYNPSPFETVEYCKKKNSKILLSVGRLTYQKGFDTLLSIWKSIQNKTDWNLYILGDGEDKDKLVKQIKNQKIKKCHLCGEKRDIFPYYKKAMFYVSTARFEGLPMTMIEAQTLGLPIVSFNYKTGPKEIITDGKDGIIVRGNSENEKNIKMGKILLELMKDEEKVDRMSKEALKSSKRFTTEEFLKNWNQILENL